MPYGNIFGKKGAAGDETADLVLDYVHLYRKNGTVTAELVDPLECEHGPDFFEAYLDAMREADSGANRNT